MRRRGEDEVDFCVEIGESSVDLRGRGVARGEDGSGPCVGGNATMTVCVCLWMRERVLEQKQGQGQRRVQEQ